MSRLKHLDLRQTAVDDAGLKHLRVGRSGLLSLLDTRVGDAGMEHLASLAALKELC